MAILPTRYPLKPPIVNILGLKSDFYFFWCRGLCVRTKNQFFGGGGGFFLKIEKKRFNKKVLYWYPAHTLKWAHQNNFTPPPIKYKKTNAMVTQPTNVLMQKWINQSHVH